MSEPDEQRAKAQETWQEASSGWARRQSSMREFSAPVTHWMLDALAPQPGEQLLEVAAGVGETGLMAAEMVAPAGKVLITDQAPGMVQAARERASELSIENVEFKEMGGEWLDLPTASLDGVLCRWGYMLMVDPATALRETRRVLKPGGRLVAAVWDSIERNPWSHAVGLTLVERGIVQPPAQGGWRPGPFALGDSERFAELLGDAGFVEVTVDALDLVRRHSDFMDFWESALDLSPDLQRAVGSLEPQDLDGLREAVRASLMPYTSEDGRLSIPARTLVARAGA